MVSKLTVKILVLVLGTGSVYGVWQAGNYNQEKRENYEKQYQQTILQEASTQSLTEPTQEGTPVAASSSVQIVPLETNLNAPSPSESNVQTPIQIQASEQPPVQTMTEIQQPQIQVAKEKYEKEKYEKEKKEHEEEEHEDEHEDEDDD